MSAADIHEIVESFCVFLTLLGIGLLVFIVTYCARKISSD
jgi:hypothetical protein